MKKLLLTLAAALTMGFAATAEELTFDFINNDYGMTRLSGSTNDYNPNPCKIEQGAVTITTVNNTRLWADGLRFYKGSSYTISVAGGTMSEVVITYKAEAAGKGFDATATTTGYTLEGKVGTWTGSADEIGFTCNITKSNVAISSIKVTYSGGTVDTRKEAGLAFAEEKVTAVLGEEFTAPAFTHATNAAITFSSDKETVATVDATTGAVTIVGEGVARITATAEANTEFKAGTASYLLTVKKGAPANALYWSELGEDFTLNNPEDAAAWAKTTNYGLKGSAYIGGKALAADALAISPVIDLTACKSAELVYDNAFNQYKLNNVMISVEDFAKADYASVLVREEGAASWSKIEGAVTTPEKFSWDFFANEPIDLSAYLGKKIEFAFRYVSTAELAGTWEIKNIAVTGEKKSDAVENIEATDNAPVEYFNLQGVRVANPENGLFIRRQGNKVSKVIL